MRLEAKFMQVRNFVKAARFQGLQVQNIKKQYYKAGVVMND